ncbi:MAG: type I-U CRISPR-associated protein Cas8c [Verrucomicrobiota bacterium]
MKNVLNETSFAIDATNPGHVFACCGLLECADRIWSGTRGWFSEDHCKFILQFPGNGEEDFSQVLFDTLKQAPISNTMTDEQVARREHLGGFSKAERKKQGTEAELKELNSLWRTVPVLIGDPLNIRIDWFLDDLAGGSTYKTWAGQQSVIDIATAMHAGFSELSKFEHTSLKPFFQVDRIPFNFDAELGRLGRDLDLGFSRDPLGMTAPIRPLVEFLAFTGLQRFRPGHGEKKNDFSYQLWSTPAGPIFASQVVNSSITLPGTARFRFRLLYRTKYLKSFLFANQTN